MKAPTDTIQYRVSHNTRPCEVRGCNSPRFGVSNYCLSHRRANRAHGHPLGVRIWPKDYAAERVEVRRILREQPDYPGAATALVWLQSLLTRSSNGSGAIASEELARLHSAHVKPKRILEECAAVWMYAHRNPHRLPDDARLTFALSTAVLRLAPKPLRSGGDGGERRYYREPSRETRRELGEAIRRVLAPLLYNLATEPDRIAEMPGARVALPLPTP